MSNINLTKSDEKAALDMVEQEILSNWTWSRLAYNLCMAGVDFDLAGNGGPACAEYISTYRRTLEAVLALTLCAVATTVGWKIHQPPNKIVRLVLFKVLEEIRGKAQSADQQRKGEVGLSRITK
jgi:hypothetical protein